MTIVNASNGVWSDAFILQIIIEEELERLKKICKRTSFKDTKFPVKIRDVHYIEKKSCIFISAFGYENKEKYPICVKKYFQKTCCFITDMRRRQKALRSYQRF